VRFDDTPLEPGRSEVVARATLWYAAVRRVHDAAVVVNVAAREDRARSGGGQRRTHDASARSLMVDVHFQEAAAAFSVRLARSDPAVSALLGGRIETAAFVDDVFGAPRFNHAPLSRFFSGVPARVRAAGNAVTIEAASGYRRPGLEQLPAFAGPLEIANDQNGGRARVLGAGPRGSASPAVRDARVWALDTLRLTVADYRVDDPLPGPSVREGATSVWDRPFRDGQRPVSVELTYTPFASITALRRGLNLSVFAFTHPIVARFLALSHGLLLAIPMFAYLVLARTRTTRLAAVARRLIVVAVAADVFNACIASQPDVNVEVPLIAPILRGLTAPVLTQLVVPAVIGLVLAAIAASIAHLIEPAESPAGVVAFEAARAVRVAALVYSAAVVAGYVAGGFAREPVLYPVLVGVLLAAVVVGLLRAAGWWTIPHARQRRAFTLATLVCALVVAVPFSLVHYGIWASSPALTATGFANATSPLALATEFLRTLAALSPFAFGLILLRGMQSGDAGLDAERFARIAFCCYAVDVSGVIVLIPISFILAWTTFGRLHQIAAPVMGGTTASDAAVAPLAHAGRTVLPLALAFAAIDLALYVWGAAPHLGELHTPFIALEAFTLVAAAAVSFVVPAVAFATWCERSSGSPAMRLALTIGAWAIACSLPAWFLRLETVGSFVAMVVVTAAFYLSLGFFFRAPAVRRTGTREAGAL
jgi:hypothetical protein